jgi:putative hemolysin
VLAIALLVIVSALFSGMETALVSLSEVKLRDRRDGGEKLPMLLGRWLDEPNEVLAMLLIGNNLVNITASALATHLTELILRDSGYAGWGIPIAVGVMTLVILIFGEVAPKTYAKHHPERYARLLPLLTFAHWVFRPFVIVLVALTRSVLQTMGGDMDSERAVVTEEDIEEMVRVGQREGSIDEQATRLLTGVLELDEKVAREIMVPRSEVHAIRKDAPMDEVITQITESGRSRYPVYGDTVDDVVGVVYTKDILGAVIRHGADAVSLIEIMRTPLVYPENIGVEDLLVEMKRNRVHMAIIASEYGGVAGIVTLEDIVEEVFGDIYDEHDVEKEPLRAVGESSWLVEGVVTLSDLEDELGIDLDDDDEDYETVAGLLMKVAGRVPTAGFTHETRGVHFEVLRSDATRLLEIAVHRQDPTEEDGGSEAELTTDAD